MSVIVAISLQQLEAFAMHDSTLGVNTWVASDTVTQLHTIDLNDGPLISTSTATEEGEAEEEEEEDVTDEAEEEEEEEEDDNDE